MRNICSVTSCRRFGCILLPPLEFIQLVLGSYIFKVILEDKKSSEQTSSTGHSLLPTITLLKWLLNGPSLVREGDIHPPYQSFFYATVSWSEAATLKGSARSHWLLAGNALGKLSKQSTDGHQNKHPWFILSFRQNWTDSHHPQLLFITFRVFSSDMPVASAVTDAQLPFQLEGQCLI